MNSTTSDSSAAWGGYWWDDKLEMYHVRHRVYDPRRMIWLQRDPLGQLAGPDEYAYVMGEPRDFYDPMGLDKWLISNPFYAVGLDSAGEYVNDLVDGAVEWKERTTGEAAKEDAKWHQVIDEQQDQVDCKLSQLVYDGKLSEEEAAKQGFAFHMQQDGDQGDVQQWSHYSKQTADQLTREVAITIVSAGVGNLAGRGLGVVGKWVASSGAGRSAGQWATRTGVSKAAAAASFWLNKPISSQFFKRSVSLDTNALINGLDRGMLAQVDAALAGRTPIVSRQAAREYLEKGESAALRKFLTDRGGRIGSSATEAEINTLRQQAAAAGRSIKQPDAMVAGSSVREGTPLMTRDRQLTEALRRLGYPVEGY